ITDTAVTFDPLQRSTARPGQELLQSFYDADVDYEFFDLDGDLTDKPVAFYAGGVWLSERGQRKLVEYVEQGGHLVCVGEIPRQDEHLLPLNLLELPEPDGIISGAPGKAALRLFGGYTIESAWWHNYDKAPGEAIHIERLPYSFQPSEELVLQFSLQEGLRYTVGYTIQRGQGRITVIGLQPSPALLLALHDHFGVTVACRSQIGGVSSALFRRGDAFYLIATNDGSEPKAALFEIAPGIMRAGAWQVENLDSGAVTDVMLMDGGILPVMIKRKDGVALRLYQS
ncbi:MAG: hypothetical protein IT319_00005, partial [Anaerolineae bacterium]|nr:hypothetical protein [Anaerolineae bacterium]